MSAVCWARRAQLTPVWGFRLGAPPMNIPYHPVFHREMASETRMAKLKLDGKTKAIRKDLSKVTDPRQKGQLFSTKLDLASQIRNQPDGAETKIEGDNESQAIEEDLQNVEDTAASSPFSFRADIFPLDEDILAAALATKNVRREVSKLYSDIKKTLKKKAKGVEKMRARGEAEVKPINEALLSFKGPENQWVIDGVIDLSSTMTHNPLKKPASESDSKAKPEPESALEQELESDLIANEFWSAPESTIDRPEDGETTEQNTTDFGATMKLYVESWGSKLSFTTDDTKAISWAVENELFSRASPLWRYRVREDTNSTLLPNLTRNVLRHAMVRKFPDEEWDLKLFRHARDDQIKTLTRILDKTALDLQWRREPEERKDIIMKQNDVPRQNRPSYVQRALVPRITKESSAVADHILTVKRLIQNIENEPESLQNHKINHMFFHTEKMSSHVRRNLIEICDFRAMSRLDTALRQVIQGDNNNNRMMTVVDRVLWERNRNTITRRESGITDPKKSPSQTSRKAFEALAELDDVCRIRKQKGNELRANYHRERMRQIVKDVSPFFEHLKEPWEGDESAASLGAHATPWKYENIDVRWMKEYKSPKRNFEKAVTLLAEAETLAVRQKLRKLILAITELQNMAVEPDLQKQLSLDVMEGFTLPEVPTLTTNPPDAVDIGRERTGGEHTGETLGDSLALHKPREEQKASSSWAEFAAAMRKQEAEKTQRATHKKTSSFQPPASLSRSTSLAPKPKGKAPQY
ncbi:hypothetical protein F5Y16DRAFT_148252 [Xylariaceae sp. FL0255]|nr:hypothetical protein F5Y16DRAFT_148252 [Xylariaceae sp. FL0255]